MNIRLVGLQAIDLARPFASLLAQIAGADGLAEQIPRERSLEPLRAAHVQHRIKTQLGERANNRKRTKIELKVALLAVLVAKTVDRLVGEIEPVPGPRIALF